MTEQKQATLFEMSNRFFDMKVRGTWGYNPNNVTMLTDSSWVEEFYLRRSVIEDGEMMMHGEDKYGRELKIPAERVLGISFLDKPEQKTLRLVTDLLDTYELGAKRAKEKGYEYPQELVDEVARLTVEKNNLIEQGVELYQRAK